MKSAVFLTFLAFPCPPVVTDHISPFSHFRSFQNLSTFNISVLQQKIYTVSIFECLLLDHFRITYFLELRGSSPQSFSLFIACQFLCCSDSVSSINRPPNLKAYAKIASSARLAYSLQQSWNFSKSSFCSLEKLFSKSS